MRRMIIFLLLLVGVTACGATADQPKSVLIGDLFTVVMGETAVIPNENLAITFDNVLEDSRCPSQVECAEMGQARGVVMVQQGEDEPINFEFNTNAAPSLNQQRITFGQYVLELQLLAPYPQKPDKPIKADAYWVTLVVTKP